MALIDSGADYTFIPVSFASTLGIDLAQCLQGDCNTAAGASTQHIWQAGLDAEVQGMRRTIHLKTAFAGTSFVCLGREDFFQEFKVAFDQRASKFTLEPYS
jgi:hypothetical protein